MRGCRAVVAVVAGLCTGCLGTRAVVLPRPPVDAELANDGSAQQQQLLRDRYAIREGKSGWVVGGQAVPRSALPGMSAMAGAGLVLVRLPVVDPHLRVYLSADEQARTALPPSALESAYVASTVVAGTLAAGASTAAVTFLLASAAQRFALRDRPLPDPLGAWRVGDSNQTMMSGISIIGALSVLGLPALLATAASGLGVWAMEGNAVKRFNAHLDDRIRAAARAPSPAGADPTSRPGTE
ncbi:MAG: hypothetical protein HY904_20070 [Deltaproteobacteria bacterium]|nr:hypothetical protein [Deltaproteobacteria bacterium]